MHNTDTRNRLLDAAECLFSRHGIEGASLRSVTAEAGVNLAAIHYHFGSKEALIHAVFARRLGPLNRERLRLLDAAQVAAGGSSPPLESIIEAFVAPALRLRQDPARGGQNFMCLIGRIHSEPSELAQTILEQFDDVFRRFTTALGHVLPHLPLPERLWKFFFMIGSMVFPLVGTEMISQKTDGLCDPADVEENIRRLVAFISAGMQAPVPEQVGEMQ